jgi:hypothetical protein
MFAEMKMLLWKDYRLSRFVFLAGAFFLGMPYLLLLFPDMDFKSIWLLSTGSAQLTMAIVAGNIIACERVDRSSSFLAYQGASRKILIGSKLIICISTFIVILTIPAIISLWLPVINNLRYENSPKPWEFLGACAAIGLCFFGVSWLMSSILSTYGLPILIGVLSPYLISCFLVGITCFLNIKFDNNSGAILIFIFLSFFGLLSLFAGTWHYIRTKEA